MRRRIFSVVMVLALCLGLLPGTVVAAAITGTLDFTDVSTPASGDGYIWDAGTKTLTLNNFSQTISATSSYTHGIVLPADATLILEGSSSIELNSGNVSRCLECKGSLTIQGDGELNLTLKSTSRIYGIGCEKVDGNKLTFESGTVNITSAHSNTGSYSMQYGIDFPHVAVSGGTVNIVDVYKGLWDRDITSGAVYQKILEVSAGELNISTTGKYEPGIGVTICSHGDASGRGILSITGGKVDISGVTQAVSCENVDVSVTGGTLNIHDLTPNRVGATFSYAFLQGGGTMDTESTIDLTGGDVSITGCSFLTSISNQDGQDAVKLPEGQSGLVWVNCFDETTGYYSEHRVRIYGDYTLDTTVLLYPNTGGSAWILDMAEGSTLTIPAGKEFDASGVYVWPTGSIDLSAGEIVIGAGGTLILPDSVAPEKLAEWNITGEGTAKTASEPVITFRKVAFVDKTDEEEQILHSSLIYPDAKIIHYPTAAKEGYILEGWYKDENLENAWDPETDTVTADMTLYAKWKAAHTVTFSGADVARQTIADGAAVTKPADPTRSGYTFGGWYREAACENAWDFETDTVTESITLYAKWTALPSGSGSSGGGGGSSSYAVRTSGIENGKVDVSPKNAGQGTTVTVTVTPDGGYVLDKLTVTGSDGGELKLTDRGGGKYTFTMPARSVTVNASFVPAAAACDGGGDCPSRAYSDLDTAKWYHGAADFVLSRGLMSGYGSGRFGPDDKLSRAQLAQILYNNAGSPAVSAGSAFTDVADDRWYTPAVIWAAENGIVNGYGGGLFGPNDSITREQLAVMLWRCAGRPAANMGLNFKDADTVSGYALEAIRWAAANGILNGYGDGLLDPQGLATRAQAAQMLKNYMSRQL